MKVIESTIDIKKLIKNSDMSIVYFTGSDCGACEAIKFKVEELLKKYPKIKSCEVNGERHCDIAAEFGVFSLPLFILYVNKKETIRVGRNLSFIDLQKDIDRYYNLMFN